VRRVLESMASVGGFVVLGRGGQAALRDRPDAVHLQLVADVGDRAARIVRSQGVTEAEAREACRRIDAERAGYVRRFYGVDIADPLLYDAVLNTSRLGTDGAVEIGTAVARRRLT